MADLKKGDVVQLKSGGPEILWAMRPLLPAIRHPRTRRCPKAGVLRNSRGFPLFALLLGVANPGRPAQEAALRIGNHLVRRLSAP